MRKLLSTALLLLLLLTMLLPSIPRAKAISRYLRVGFTSEMPPFQFVEEEKAVGMHIDILDAIAAKRDYSLEYIPFHTNTECYDALASGQIDLILGVVEQSHLDDSAFLHTDPISSSQLCLIVEKDAEEIRTQKIETAIFSFDTMRPTMLSNLGVHQYISVGTQQEVYLQQQTHPGSAMIGIKDSLIYILKTEGVDSGYTIRNNYLGSLEFILLMRGSDRDLRRAMNEGIAQFKASSKYDDICNRWLQYSDPTVRLEKNIRIIMTAFVATAIVVLVYIIIARRIQMVLRRRVAEQTAQLRCTNAELEKQYEQLQNENDLRNRIIKYSPSGMILFDVHYTITMMNNSAARMVRLPEPETGGNVLEIPVFGDIVRAQGEGVFVQGATVSNGSIRLVNGRPRVYNYTMHQVLRYGQIVGTLLSVQDITEADRIRQTEFDREKSSALTRIVAGLAHEIRNPLTSIRTFAALIGEQGDNRQVQQSFAKYVPEEVDRINKLIENLIHYARPAVRRPERICVSEILDSSLALIRPLLRKKQFALDCQLEPELYIFADPDQLKQVIVNILINGLEAMEKKLPQEGHTLTMTVTSTAWEQNVVITIRDEGIGMDDAQIRSCRDPFFSTKKGGTGLGLALCDQYIRENNGTLQIEAVKDSYTEISLIFERS